MIRRLIVNGAICSVASLVLYVAVVSLRVGNAAETSRHVPTIDELLTIKSIGGAQISPDGKLVAYTVTNGDFKQDAFVTQVWLVEVGAGRNIQLTRGEKSSTNPRWSPDSTWLAFTSNRIDDKNQIFVINPAGGEAIQLTKSETPIANFAWSEDGRSIAYTATEPVPQVSKDRKEYLGDYEVVRKDYNYAHLWTLDVNEALNGPVVGKQRTKKKDFSVDSFGGDEVGLAAWTRQQSSLVAGRQADRLFVGDGRYDLLCQQLSPGCRAGIRGRATLHHRQFR